MWLEIRDDQGRVTLDGDTRVSRLIGMVDGNAAGGTISDAELARGEGWAICLPIEGYTAFDVLSVATVSGTTVTYTASKKRFRVLYGTK